MHGGGDRGFYFQTPGIGFVEIRDMALIQVKGSLQTSAHSRISGHYP